MTMAEEELVVLCAEDGTALGAAPKATVHGSDTPLHLAFSSYVFDPDGRVLVTRRAHSKQTFAGVRTNSCCGHPAPGESGASAVARRLQHELGVLADRIDLVLPRFRYWARDRSGVVENELCPVYRVLTSSSALAPDPAEVGEAWWSPWSQFAGPSSTADAGDPLSRWARLQLLDLVALGPDPLAWPIADGALLPKGIVA